MPYNGQFTFVRVNYTTAPGGYWYQGLPAWSHGYPIAEQNLMRILNEISDLGPAHRGDQQPEAGRSRAVQVPGRVHHRSRLVGDDRLGSRRACGLTSRRADSSSSTTSRWPASAAAVSPGWAAAAGIRSSRTSSAHCPTCGSSTCRRRSHLSLVLRDQSSRHHPAGLQCRPAGLSRRVRRQRSEPSGCR